MPNYANAKIYKIVDNTSDKIYIGSTCKTLSSRLSAHRCAYKSEKCKYCTSFEVLKNGDFDIILIEEVNCQNIEQLRARERHHIETNICVNKKIPNHTKAESDKVYYEKNKEKIIQYVAKWKQANLEHVKELRRISDKIYREKNREKINQRNRDNYNSKN
jgi:methionine synthase I (cobalamin-dependent)